MKIAITRRNSCLLIIRRKEFYPVYSLVTGGNQLAKALIELALQRLQRAAFRPCWRVVSVESNVPMRVDQSDANPLAGSQWCHEFRALELVSAGAYGFVWRCLEEKSGELVAIKFISRDRSKLDRNAEREIINHAMLVHPHIIEFKLCFLTEKYLAIAMDYAGGDDLLQYVFQPTAIAVAFPARGLYEH